jgi:hypothetical protein
MEIRPLEGLAGLAFGRSRWSVREAWGTPEPFRRAAYSPVLTDAYVRQGLMLNYDERDLLHSVEVAFPAPVSLRGVGLIGRDHRAVLAELRAAGVAPVEVDKEWVLPELGIALGRPRQDTPEDFESVLVSSRPRVDYAISFFEGGAGAPLPEEFQVVPHAGFGPVRTGLARQELRELLGAGMASVPDVGPAAQDNFFAGGIVVGYDQSDHATRVVITGPARVTYQGMELLGRPLGEIVAAARERGLPVRPEEAALRFPEAGFSVWTARAGDDSLPSVAVAVVPECAG